MFSKLLATVVGLAGLAAARQVTVWSNDEDQIRYTGTDWVGATDRIIDCSSGSPTYYHSEHIGDYFTFTFTGTAIEIVTLGDSDRGLISFQLDGGTAANVDTRTWPRSCRTVYTTTGLENKSHTVVVKLVGKSPTNLNNDGIVICLESITYTQPDSNSPTTAGGAGAQSDPPPDPTPSSPDPAQTTTSQPPADSQSDPASSTRNTNTLSSSGTLPSGAPITPSDSSSISGGAAPSGVNAADQTAQQPEASSNPPTVPIVVGVLGGVILILLILLFLRWRKARASANDAVLPPTVMRGRVPSPIFIRPPPTAGSRRSEVRPLTAQSYQTVQSQESHDPFSSPSSSSAPTLPTTSQSFPSPAQSLPPLQPVRRLPPIPPSLDNLNYPVQAAMYRPVDTPSDQLSSVAPSSHGMSSRTDTSIRSEEQIIALARQIARHIREDPSLGAPAPSNLQRSGTVATYMREPPPQYQEP